MAATELAAVRRATKPAVTFMAGLCFARIGLSEKGITREMSSVDCECLHSFLYFSWCAWISVDDPGIVK